MCTCIVILLLLICLKGWVCVCIHINLYMYMHICGYVYVQCVSMRTVSVPLLTRVLQIGMSCGLQTAWHQPCAVSEAGITLKGPFPEARLGSFK